MGCKPSPSSACTATPSSICIWPGEGVLGVPRRVWGWPIPCGTYPLNPHPPISPLSCTPLHPGHPFLLPQLGRSLATPRAARLTSCSRELQLRSLGARQPRTSTTPAGGDPRPASRLGPEPRRPRPARRPARPAAARTSTAAACAGAAAPEVRGRDRKFAGGTAGPTELGGGFRILNRPASAPHLYISSLGYAGARPRDPRHWSLRRIESPVPSSSSPGPRALGACVPVAMETGGCSSAR